MIPEVVVFDLGKVLLDFDYRIAASRIVSRSRLSLEEAQHALSRSPLLVEYETGRISTPDFLRHAIQATGYTGDPRDFADAFSDIFTPILPLVEAQAALRGSGVRTFIFSNTNPLAVGHIRSRFSFFLEFDGYVLSYEQGAMKPEPPIYEAVERLTRKKGPAILYIDDRPENLATGRARGWQVILQDNPERSRREIEQTFQPG